MIAIVSVLLIPAAGDPQQLLREGPCGARPPMATVYRYRGWLNNDLSDWTIEKIDPEYVIETQSEQALVLAWKGEVVPEGCDRAYRAAGDRPERYHRMSEMPDAGRWFGSLGTIVLLDADGREVTP